MRIAGYLPNSTTDGIGVRQVFFTQGCNHHCKGCHNPQTWDYDTGNEWDNSEIVSMALKSPYNVTFSGGDPFIQAHALRLVCAKLKPFKNIWVYTGYTLEEIMDDPIMDVALAHIDVLVDGRFVEELRDSDLLFRGSSNQRLIDVQETLKQRQVVLFDA